MLCVKIINRLIREQSVPWSEGNTFTLTGCAITPARIWRQLALHGSLQGIILNLHDTSTFASLSLANPVPNWCKVRANASWLYQFWRHIIGKADKFSTLHSRYMPLSLDLHVKIIYSTLIK